MNFLFILFILGIAALFVFGCFLLGLYIFARFDEFMRKRFPHF